MNCRAKIGEQLDMMRHKGLSIQMALKLILSRLGAKDIRLTSKNPGYVDFNINRKPTVIELRLAAEEAFPVDFLSALLIRDIPSDFYNTFLTEVIDINSEKMKFTKKVKVFFKDEFYDEMKSICKNKNIGQTFTILMKNYGYDVKPMAQSDYRIIFEDIEFEEVLSLLTRSGLLRLVSKIQTNKLGNLRYATVYRQEQISDYIINYRKHIGGKNNG